jgi:hypothetical protein
VVSVRVMFATCRGHASLHKTHFAFGLLAQADLQAIQVCPALSGSSPGCNGSEARVGFDLGLTSGPCSRS